MSETALYYTLSTVSQTLAGALGMLAAFLAIQTSALDAALRAEISEMESRHGPDPAVRPTSGSTAEMLGAWRVRLNTVRDSYSVLLLERGERLLRKKARILRTAARAFAWSAAVMGACFVGLATTPWLSCTRPRAWTAAAVAIAGGIACLVWYGKIVREALD